MTTDVNCEPVGGDDVAFVIRDGMLNQAMLTIHANGELSVYSEGGETLTLSPDKACSMLACAHLMVLQAIKDSKNKKYGIRRVKH
jgi:hypothetical protein